MERSEVAEMISSKVLSRDFHWFAYHFETFMLGYEHFLAASIVNCCHNIEPCMSGFSNEFSDRLASLSDKEKYLPHYEQIIQLLAELFVINHVCMVFPENSKFIAEPKSKSSNKNPELGIKTGDKEIYVEVKCREFITHHNNRGNARLELPTRMSGVREIAQGLIQPDESIVYPRDNVVKDFLISANEKFKGFKNENPNSITVLVIVWDDFTYEAVSSLLNKATGLITNNSFYRKDNEAVKFEYIDAIILVKHSHQLVRATRDELPMDGLSHLLDWGNKQTGLPKAFIPINSSAGLDEYLCEIFQAYHIEGLNMFSDFHSQDIVFRV